MDQRIRIEKRTPVQDAAGEQGLPWLFITEIWAGIESLPGTEQFQGEQFVGRVPTRITIRPQPGLTFAPEMRAVCGQRVFDIASASPEPVDPYQINITAAELVGETP